MLARHARRAPFGRSLHSHETFLFSVCRRLHGIHEDRADVLAVDALEPGKNPVGSSKDIFRCPGIEAAAVQMRRRVQLGVALEVFGVQVSNFLYHSSWTDYAHAMETFHFENSAILLGVHVLVMWKYHAFLRDALLARHVTRIALAEEAPLALGEDDIQGGAGDKPAYTLLIQTGPWTRRVELMKAQLNAAKSDEVSNVGSQIPISRLFQLGLLHLDRKQGKVVDEIRFEDMLHGNFVIGKEEITTDVIHANLAFVSPDSMLPFLAEAAPSGGDSANSLMAKLQKNEWLHKTFQLHGGRVMVCFGNLALSMGIGMVVMWSVPWR